MNMDFEAFEPLVFDSWPDSTPNSSSNCNIYSPNHLASLWHEPALTNAGDDWQSTFPKTPVSAHELDPEICKKPDTSAFSHSSDTLPGLPDTLADTQSTGLEGLISTPASGPDGKDSEKCSCLRQLLLVTEQLDQHLPTATSFSTTLALYREVIQICETYSKCRDCEECLTEMLCILALRRASVCYKQAASTTQESTLPAGQERKVSCKVGHFETEIALDADMCKAVLCSEVERAVSITNDIEKLLEPGSSVRSSVDAMTRRYHHDLVKTVHNDLRITLYSLQKC